MTSSAIKTEPDSENPEDARYAGRGRARGLVRTRRRTSDVVWIARLSALLLILVGWGVVLQYNRWNFGAPVLFLMFGWSAVIGTGWFLWRAAWMAANDDPAVGDDFWRLGADGETLERGELEHEKRALLKAIKEIEFDHQLGKMSDADADQLIRLYRSRAIDIIKALDAVTDEGALSVAERIEREVRARLAVEAGGIEAAAKSATEAVRRVEARAKAGDVAAAEASTKASEASTKATEESTKASEESTPAAKESAATSKESA